MMDLVSERWHFIGIGGAGMSALAAALLDLGARVSGSDAADSDALRELRARGATVALGHDPANLGDATRVVLTAALRPDNPELVQAERRGLPLVKRAALLGMLMDLRRGVAVAGTHGKTTTSAMIAWVLARAGHDPSYMVGGSIRGLGPGGHWGAGLVLVAEADEYDSSFLQLRPDVAVITNIEADHLDYYGTYERIFSAFREFAANLHAGGLLVACADDPATLRLCAELTERGAPFRIQTYGLSDSAVWRPRLAGANAHGGLDFTVLYGGREVARVSPRVPGLHNALNSLAALAACVELGLEPSEAAEWLGLFEGAGRRFEPKGEVAGVLVVDDYAHHPTEIAATLDAARRAFPGRRLVVVFQPHTYTRTRDFLDRFAEVLDRADRVIVAEIYASRETDTLGLTALRIVEKMVLDDAFYARNLHEAAELVLDDARPGDVILTLGAGDVWKAGVEVLEALEARSPGDGAQMLGVPSARLVARPTGAGGTPRRGAPSPTITFRPDVVARLEEETGLQVTRDEPMSRHDSLRIGGPATLYMEVDTVEQLVSAVLSARRLGLPYLVLGNGTNLLVGDYGVDALVIHNRSRNISHELQDDGSSIWHVDSGLLFSRLARITCDQGWTGLEWSNSVPGSVGGGIVSNAGAHGKEIKDDLLSIDVLTATGAVENWPTDTLEFAYRTSRFKAHGRRDLSPGEVVLRAHIRLQPDTGHDCEARMRGFLEERQAKQPQGKSAGSTFKNPPGYSAGYLIEQVGLKGFQHGQAQFSPKHANFMMNLGGATAADVLHLMDLAKKRVKKQFGIDLEPEIEIVGD